MIGVVTPFDFQRILGGGSQRIKSDLSALCAIGQEVEAILPSRIWRTAVSQQEELTLVKYPSLKLPGNSSQKTQQLLDMYTQSLNPFFRRALGRRDKYYSTVFAHFPWTAVASYSVVGGKTPIVYVAHNFEYGLVRQATQNPVVRRIIHSLERRACKSSTKILCVSDHDRANLGQAYEVPDKKLSVLPNTVDCAFFSQTSDLYDKHEERQRLELPPSSYVVLFHGRMDYRANSDALTFVLSEVIPALKNSSIDVSVVVAGAQIPEWCLSNPYVFSYSDVPDMRRFLAIADAIIVPLRIGGGTRLKILESFAAGVPVISSVKGADGIECQDGSHILIAEESGEDFAKKVEALALNENLRKEIAGNAFNLVARKYSISAAGNCYQEVIDSIAN